MNFGKNVQILRKMANMTQEELAEKMNVSRQTVSKWELGTVLPELEKLLELCDGFNCSVDQLLRGNMDYSNAALILADDHMPGNLDVEIKSQNRQNYITITLAEIPGAGEFALIPNAYKALLTYMAINGIKEKHDPGMGEIPAFSYSSKYCFNPLSKASTFPSESAGSYDSITLSRSMDTPSAISFIMYCSDSMFIKEEKSVLFPCGFSHHQLCQMRMPALRFLRKHFPAGTVNIIPDHGIV